MAHLVVGSVQPGGTVGAQLGAVEAAVGARAQRARQRGVRTATERARRRPSGSPEAGGRALEAVGTVHAGMAADAEIDSARNGAGRAVDDRRPTELKASSADARPRRRTILLHYSAEQRRTGEPAVHQKHTAN